MRPHVKTRSPRAGLALLIATAAVFLLVPAAQALAAPEATVIPVGEGSGEVFSGYEGSEAYVGNPKIECGWNGSLGVEGEVTKEPCANEMEQLEPSTAYEFLNAAPDEDSKLVEWFVESGTVFARCEPVGGGAIPNECWITSEGEPVVVYAVFECKVAAPCPPTENEWSLTASKSGSGNGWIHSEASEYLINCGGPCTSKTAVFPEGIVELTASGAEFAGWEVCPGTEVGRVCEVALTADTEAVAEFVANHALTVTKTGAGNGWIHSEAPEYTINCGGPCTSKTGFFTQPTVELTASGSQFVEWESGAPCVSGGGASRICVVEMDADKTAEAKFE